MTEKLKFEMQDHTALITIDNPGANTWDADNLQALEALIKDLNADPNCYSLVITGAGELRHKESDRIAAVVDGLRGLEAAGGWGEARVLTRPSRLSAVLRKLDEEEGLQITAQMGFGELRLHLPGLGEVSSERQVEWLGELRQILTPLGARLEPRTVQAQAHAELASALATQPALDWMHRLQDELDPTGQFRSPSFPGRRA